MRTPRQSRPLKLLLAALALAGCYDVAAPARRATILTLPDTGTADGASLLLVGVTIDTTGLPADERIVTLNTTAGVFKASGSGVASVTPDATGSAIALLRAPTDSTLALVTATVGKEAVLRTVTFHRALPDRVEVVPAQLAVGAGTGHQLALTIYLQRAVGTPSPGAHVMLHSAGPSPADSAPGVFLPAELTSDATGMLHATFATRDTSYRGPVTLRATVAPIGGVSGEATVVVTAP